MAKNGLLPFVLSFLDHEHNMVGETKGSVFGYEKHLSENVSDHGSLPTILRCPESAGSLRTLLR
jgi:hypothetical protein